MSRYVDLDGAEREDALFYRDATDALLAWLGAEAVESSL